MTTTRPAKQTRKVRQQAEELWERLAKNLFDFQTTLIEVIELRAWEPLGYATFAQAWADRMSDITIAPEIRPHVVYQMFAEGATADVIADAVKGIGPEQVAVLKRQRDHGVAPKDATLVHQHLRGRRRKHWIAFEIDAETDLAWRRKAKVAGQSLAEIAAAAVTAAFEALP